MKKMLGLLFFLFASLYLNDANAASCTSPSEQSAGCSRKGDSCTVPNGSGTCGEYTGNGKLTCGQLNCNSGYFSIGATMGCGATRQTYSASACLPDCCKGSGGAGSSTGSSGPSKCTLGNGSCNSQAYNGSSGCTCETGSCNSGYEKKMVYKDNSMFSGSSFFCKTSTSTCDMSNQNPYECLPSGDNCKSYGIDVPGCEWATTSNCCNGYSSGCYCKNVKPGYHWTLAERKGKYSPGPILCEVGYYCEGGLKDHTKCPSGKTSNAGAKSSSDCFVSCASNQYYDASSGQCVNCSTGCKSCTADGCTVCESGYLLFTPMKPYQCVKACSAGYFATPGGCQICPQGNYCPANSIQPTACPSGKTTNGTGKTSSSDCITPPSDEEGVCPTGNVSVFTVCPELCNCFKCKDNGVTKYYCKDCKQCGTFRTSDYTCQPIPGCTPTTGGTTPINTCPSGKSLYSGSSIEGCVATSSCYSNGQTKYYCTSCNTGYALTSQGTCTKAECSNLNEKFCLPLSGSANSGCGNYYNAPSTAGCSKWSQVSDCCNTNPGCRCTGEAIKGYYWDKTEAPYPTKCPAGQTTDGPGATSITQCYPDCPTGQSLKEGKCVPDHGT
ncbi:MAG: hypothetical protein MJ247_05310, partial [Alphaproteobacteria bacterium]|nr:hypothetical protein [Alphaproteobacteria bacterium]